jgi:hypothetical protein
MFPCVLNCCRGLLPISDLVRIANEGFATKEVKNGGFAIDGFFCRNPKVRGCDLTPQVIMADLQEFLRQHPAIGPIPVSEFEVRCAWLYSPVAVSRGFLAQFKTTMMPDSKPRKWKTIQMTNGGKDMDFFLKVRLCKLFRSKAN